MPETMTNTRKIAHIAILSTLSFLLMYLQFPLIPSASFLQFDFSAIITAGRELHPALKTILE